RLNVLDLRTIDELDLLRFRELNLDRLVILPSKRADHHRAITKLDRGPAVETFDFVGNGRVFFHLAPVDNIRIMDSLQRLIGRNSDYVQFVDLPELARFSQRRTGHSGDLVVELEEILQRDRREG